MGLVVGLILLAIALAVLGLVIKALKWLIIIAVVVLVVGLARGAIAGRNNKAL
ncbi:MAG: hypothetical protein ACR2KO_05810 [Geodermatophilaceae bacterium]|jgi:hypothetical protein|nr:hypothetical protein [Geodermatophilaceae bacterium]